MTSHVNGMTLEYVIKCSKPDQSLSLMYVRSSDSVGDVETEACVLMKLVDCPYAEVWRGERLLSRFVRPVATAISLAAA